MSEHLTREEARALLVRFGGAYARWLRTGEADTLYAFEGELIDRLTGAHLSVKRCPTCGDAVPSNHVC